MPRTLHTSYCLSPNRIRASAINLSIIFDNEIPRSKEKYFSTLEICASNIHRRITFARVRVTRRDRYTWIESEGKILERRKLEVYSTRSFGRYRAEHAYRRSECTCTRHARRSPAHGVRFASRSLAVVEPVRSTVVANVRASDFRLFRSFDFELSNASVIVPCKKKKEKN